MIIAVNCWENRKQCANCINRTTSGCDVINGIESPCECPAVQDFNYNNEVTK